MKIKKYIAPTMPEAMKEIRKELGADAVILNSKEIHQGGFLGLFKKKKIEVVAALDPEPVSIKAEKKLVDRFPSNKQTQNTKDDVLTEIRQLKKLLEIQTKNTSENFQTEFQIIYQHLLDQEVARPLAKKIIDYVLVQHEGKKDVSTTEILRDTKSYLENMLKAYTSAGINYEKKVVQFVGPTGVGKTTTIAKLASNCILLDNKRVAFITTDTYRIAAVEQLKTYARILNVPLEVAYTVQDYRSAIEKFQDYDIIFVDTAGRNFRKEKYVKDLRDSMDQKTEIETYLVMSLTAKPNDISEIYDQFHHIPIKEVIFTKVDETRQYGSVLNFCLEKQLGVAYMTNGQDVPNDIINANPAFIANLIVGDLNNE